MAEHPDDVCQKCHARRGDHIPWAVEDVPILRCPSGCGAVKPDFFLPAASVSVVAGVGPDAPTVVNEAGGKQSHSPYRCDLLPAMACLEVAAVLKTGADKYGAENWRNISVSDHVNHALVHLFALQAGDTADHHLAHAACRILMALDLDVAAQCQRGTNEPRT